jgi:hypothetical protein
MKEAIKTYKFLVEKLEGKSPHGRARRRWDDNIKWISEEIDWEFVNWIHMALGRDRGRTLVNTVRTFDFQRRKGIY